MAAFEKVTGSLFEGISILCLRLLLKGCLSFFEGFLEGCLFFFAKVKKTKIFYPVLKGLFLKLSYPLFKAFVFQGVPILFVKAFLRAVYHVW